MGTKIIWDILKIMPVGQTIIYNEVKNLSQKIDKLAEADNQEDVEIPKFHLANEIDMRTCNLGGAGIRESVFTNAKLEGAILPNHFSSRNQKEQLAHMRELGYI